MIASIKPYSACALLKKYAAALFLSDEQPFIAHGRERVAYEVHVDSADTGAHLLLHDDGTWELSAIVKLAEKEE